MGKKKTTGIILILLTLCLFTGCLFSLPTDHLGKIEGDITCDFRAGKNATHKKETVKTDAVFDKDRFVELYNEDAKYDPSFYKHHTDRLDLKINADEEREKFEEIAASEVNFRVYFNEQNRHVSLFRYDSKLYFFIMSMGGRSKPDEKGYYYQEVPEKMADYWNPIYDKVMADKEADRKQMYGSFNVEEAMSYDKKFTAKVLIGSGMVTVQIIDNETDSIVSSFKPCGKGEFYGICWENDSYNLWVQTDTSLVICYSMKESKWDWQINENARKPDYIKGRYD
jgi:hypothetical protein